MKIQTGVMFIVVQLSFVCAYVWPKWVRYGEEPLPLGTRRRVTLKKRGKPFWEKGLYICSIYFFASIPLSLLGVTTTHYPLPSFSTRLASWLSTLRLLPALASYVYVGPDDSLPLPRFVRLLLAALVAAAEEEILPKVLD